MTLKETFLSELKQEAIATRQLLAIVPFAEGEFKPHAKSMTLLRLSTHVAEISGWWKECILDNELDFAKPASSPPKEFKSTQDLVDLHDKHITQAIQILTDIDEKEFDKMWTMRSGDQIFFTLPKGQVARTWCLNHWYHHRGQLTVYLRLLNVPLPATYATTADLEGK
jgi:uncharacterized damage-inducible protein DinB